MIIVLPIIIIVLVLVVLLIVLAVLFTIYSSTDNELALSASISPLVSWIENLNFILTVLTIHVWGA